VRLFKKLRRKIQYLNPEYVEKIFQAYQLGADAHRGQRRHSGEPYITHPVAVACILADMHMDAQSIIAALLHDVIEDTEVDKESIAAMFDDVIAELVDGVSKLTQIEFKSRAEARAENFLKMILAMSRDIRVIIIKLADRLHNMRTIEALAPVKRRRIAKETLEIYAPIAQRLGMHTIAIELETLGFAILYPHRYQVLKDEVRKVRGNQKKILNLIEKNLQEGLKQRGLGKANVYGREKHLYSIYKKMRIRGLSFTEIMDVHAFRIITKSIDDCYRALGVAHSLYKPLPERFKDYIAIPKANGYQSLHSTLFGPYGVPVEIQIRTEEMEQMANSGIAAHWLYKSNEKMTDESQVRAQQWVKNLLEIQQKIGNSLEFIESVKMDLFPDEVYVFTPKGDIMELPTGSAIVDFAYAVHTDIGNSCVAAKIDRQLAPLSTVLSSGQTVEIVTSHNAHPNPAWLDFVVTARARSGIRHYLKTQRRTQSISLGKQLLNKALGGLSSSIKKIPHVHIQRVLQASNLTAFDDLLESIGSGERIAMLVAYQLVGKLEGPIHSLQDIEPAKPLLIKGTEGMVIDFASCCYPVPGDPILGVLSSGYGIVVHQENCVRTKKLRKHPEKCMTVSWSDDVQGEFVAMIKVTGVNQRGVLARLAQAIANADANIDDIRVDERDAQHFAVGLKLHVRNRVHLANVLRNIHNLKPVTKVARGK
jgi:GTP diphosphokinase / guanosine-3',5'-bis(diphosphate) 3'-diphosphatase